VSRECKARLGRKRLAVASGGACQGRATAPKRERWSQLLPRLDCCLAERQYFMSSLKWNVANCDYYYYLQSYKSEMVTMSMQIAYTTLRWKLAFYSRRRPSLFGTNGKTPCFQCKHVMAGTVTECHPLHCPQRTDCCGNPTSTIVAQPCRGREASVLS
jgi:hypothetical protein